MKQPTQLYAIPFQALLVFNLLKIQICAAESLLTNTNQVGSLHNPMKLKYTTNTAVNGIPIAVHQSPTSAHCAYECRKHLQCRKATFWKSHTCHIHSRQSINGMYSDDQAVTIDYMDGDTHILIIGGKKQSAETDKVLELIPETKMISTLSTSLNIPRRSPSFALHDAQILIVGGNKGSSYVSSSEVFSGVPLPAKANQPSIAPSDRFVACGGIANDHFYNCFGSNSSEPNQNNCDVYDLNNEYSFTRLQSNIPGRNRLSCVFKGNYIYVIGGFVFGVGAIDEVFKVNLVSGSSQALSNFPTLIYFASSVWYKGDIVVCGGQRSATVFRRACKKYILSTNQWVSFAPLNIARSFHVLVNWGMDKILAIGGRDAAGVALTSIEVYENGGWSQFANLPFPLRGMAVVNLDEYF